MAKEKTSTFIISKNLADEPIDIAITGLTPGQNVTLHATTSLPAGAAFESFAHYAADYKGNIALDKAKSLGGTYEGIESMGPFWSMVPSPFNKRKHERFLVKEPSQPFIVKFQLYDGFIPTLEEIEAAPSGSQLAQTDITRTYMAAGVQEFEIRQGRIRAVLYLPPGDGPFPGVISFSGGYPGAMKHKASLLASRGFAALALKFFGVDDLPVSPSEDVDLSYFEEAAHFLKDHPKVDGKNGVAMIANCFGGWIALAFASCAPSGLINCVVSISGYFYSSEVFRYRGRTWGTAPGFELDISQDPKGLTIWSFKSDVDITFPGNVFDFHQRHDIPYMLVYGGKDGYYNTKQISTHAKTLLESARHPDYTILFYPGAGHLVEHAYCPLAKIAWTYHEPHFNGGEQPFHGKAEMDSWPKILSFVRNRLVKGGKNQSKL